MASLVSSLPLSLITILGSPRSITSRSSSRATEISPGTRGGSHRPRQNAAAATVRELIQDEVEDRWSLGAISTVIVARDPIARLPPRRRRIASLSSR